MPGNRNTKGKAMLDGFRLRHGNGQLGNIFHDSCLRNHESAAALVNDGRLRFPALYLLRPEIRKLGLEGSLNARNRRALELSELFMSPGQPGTYAARPEDLPVLRWMLRTGHAEEGLGEQYDAIMDAAAILLAREHRDIASLPYIEKMIFARHGKGLYTHDAEWALFESGDPRSLEMVSRRLLSQKGSDVELARRLLGFVPCFGDSAASPARQYRCASQWISLNRPRLAYTGESSLKGGNPCRFEVVEAAGAPAASGKRRSGRLHGRKGTAK